MGKKKSQLINPVMEDKKILKSYKVEKVVPGGDGLVRIDGKVCFIPGALPGEIIDFKIDKEGKKFSRGSLVEIIKPAPDRSTPFCPLYGSCGGCNMQHLDYSSQLKLKESFVREHFLKQAGLTLPEEFSFVPSQDRHYRNRVQLHQLNGRTGFKMRGGDEIISVSHCPVLVESLNDLLAGSPSLHNERETVFGYGDKSWNETQQDTITVTINAKSVRFKAGLFFQSNVSILPELLKYALDGYSGNHAMDLYCGVGLFSVFLKDKYREITGIELNPETEKYYRDNMAGSQYQYFGMSLEKWLNKKRNKNTELIVVDPPRTGLSDKVRMYLAEMKVPDLVYVSCDPVTQARDARDLTAAGYRLEGIRGFDFYPHTSHMETVCRFSIR